MVQVAAPQQKNHSYFVVYCECYYGHWADIGDPQAGVVSANSILRVPEKLI